MPEAVSYTHLAPMGRSQGEGRAGILKQGVPLRGMFAEP